MGPEDTDRVLAVLAEHFETEEACRLAFIQAAERIKVNSAAGCAATFSRDEIRALDFVFRSISGATEILFAIKKG